jgi:hypothetical protein
MGSMTGPCYMRRLNGVNRISIADLCLFEFTKHTKTLSKC